jgi:hypothetical protein
MIPQRRDIFIKQRSGLFIQRFYDMADYQVGYLINVFGIFRLLKFKVSKIMEKPDWILIVEVMGHEFVLH